MDKVNVTDLPSEPEGSEDVDRRELTSRLGTTDLAINYFNLKPGEAFSGGLHAHMDQEEVFYVIKGTATFEIKNDAAEDSGFVEVGPAEAIRFSRGEYQQGRNTSDSRVVALALGAPKDSVEGRVPVTCPDCEESEYQVTIMEEGRLMLQCPECNVIHESHLH
jgi:uncharacterized cupin superfamily protein